MLKRNAAGLSVLAMLGVLVLAVSFYFTSAGAGAEDRDWHPDLDGPRPPEEIPDAPPVTLLSAQQPILVATFDEQPADWDLNQRTYFPYEFGVWESAAGKLVQSGSEEGRSLVETFLIAPASLDTLGEVAVQVFPQGNQVLGVVFGFTEDGYYTYRVYRQTAHNPQNPAVTHLLEYYDATTMEYRMLAEKTTADGLPGFRTGDWHELRVLLTGDRIQTAYAGEPVFDVEEPTIASGQVGVFTLAMGEVLFDNFTVAQP